jgi:hypothetical protein
MPGLSYADGILIIELLNFSGIYPKLVSLLKNREIG